MKIKVFLLISVLINIFLLYLILKPAEKSSNTQRLLDKYILKQKDKIKADSLQFANRNMQLEKDLNRIKNLRKKEHEKYLYEISKFERTLTDSTVTYLLDSIKQVCCPNNNR